jgi:mannitol-1-phosphate 5-dehydrogenase
MNKKMLIIGAGKIGRGFLADIFGRSGYELIVADASEELVDAINRQGQYTLVNIPGRDKREERSISIEEALHTENQREQIIEQIASVPLIGVAVFPGAFDGVAELLAAGINRRAESGHGDPETAGPQAEGNPLDIIICANVVGPGEMLRERIETRLTEAGKDFFAESVGLVDSLVVRIGIEPTSEMKQEDPLTVVTNGFPYLVVDKTGFKGTLPDVDGLEFTENIERDEMRKIYTYNMIHAVFAYLGAQKGYTDVLESLGDEQIMACARGALEEAGTGLQIEYGLTDEDRVKWYDEVMTNMTNPALADSIARIGRDPKRKLEREGRLTGAALLCRKHGYYPHYLCKAIGAAFLFHPEGDPSAPEIEEELKRSDSKTVIKKYCGLDREPELVQMIYEQYQKAKEGTLFDEDPSRVEVLKRAYNLGFEKEKVFHGCAQCTLAALFELTGKEHPLLFQAASGLAGGIGLCGDGSCGGYTGGIMDLGSYAGRRLEHIDGDKETQYKSFKMAQKLRDRYMETYGSVTCKDIHEEIFGRAYILKTKPVRVEFEEAGAHTDKCTTVIACATMWTADLLMEEGFFTPSL